MEVKNVNVAIPAGIKDELDVHFNWRGKPSHLTNAQVDAMMNSRHAARLFRSHVEEVVVCIGEELPEVSEKHWEMDTLQGAINVFIAVGLHSYRESVKEAERCYPTVMREDAYCRECDKRVVSVGECCEECGEYVVMDDV